MRRVTAFLLAFAILIGCVIVGSPLVYAAEMTMSEEGMKLLKAEEGFSKYPYWDYRQYTVGYGTKCPSDMVNHYKTYGITHEEAETLLRNYMSGMEYTLNRYIEKHNLVLNQNQYDAIALFSYNVGTGWTTQTSGTFFQAITGGATGNDLIRAFGLWCKADGQIRDYLLRRRMSEANLYLNGVYSQQPPESYGYVIYEPNGGSVSHSAQVFNSAEPVLPICDATLGGYTFMGWYTAKVGGYKVAILDETVKNLTLYAQWLPNSLLEHYTDTVDVTVTLTGTGVNLRGGPGADFDVVGSAYKGETLLISETVLSGEILWGRSEKGWIALQFTNFEEVYAALPPDAFLPPVTEPTEPETTVPETTVPETTVPETTVPETTVPETTVPETTVPETTVPETTAPPATEPPATEPPATEPPVTEPPTTEPPVTQWEGTVTASTLNIRSTPGGQYKGYYVRGTKVTVLERIEVDGTPWGRTDKGWICLSYVELSEPPVTEPPVTEPPVTEPPVTEPPVTEPPVTEPPATEPPVTQWEGKITASTLNIRSTPGGKYLGYYVRGTKVVILEKKTVNGTPWGRTDKGWICLTYVEIEEPPVTEPPATEPPVTQLEGKVTASKLNIRSTPGGKYLGYYVRGTKVIILEQKTVDGTPWGRTDKGWICLTYVELAEVPQPVEKMVTASSLRVRSGAGTTYSVVTTLKKGTKVTILETKTVNGVLWGRTDRGWLSMEYVK